MSMTAKDRLEMVVAAYGADPRRWPADDRHLAALLPGGAVEAAAVDRLLAQASRPGLPAGARARLDARLAAMPGPVRIVARSGAEPGKAWSLPWLAGLPLAASLALGIYLGAAGSLDSILPSIITGATATADAGDDWSDFGGMSDAEQEAAGSLS
jgi:hypothetical protein